MRYLKHIHFNVISLTNMAYIWNCTLQCDHKCGLSLQGNTSCTSAPRTGH